MSDCNTSTIRYLNPTNRRYWTRVFLGNASLTNDFRTKTTERNTIRGNPDVGYAFGLGEESLYEAEARWRRSSGNNGITYYSSQQSNLTLIFPDGNTINMEGSFIGTTNIYQNFYLKSEDGTSTLGKALEPIIIVQNYGYSRSRSVSTSNVFLDTRYAYVVYFYPDYAFYTNLREIVCNNETIIGYAMNPTNINNIANRNNDQNDIISIDKSGNIIYRSFNMFVVMYSEDVFDRINNIKNIGSWKSESWGTDAEMPNPPTTLFPYHYPCLSLLNRAYFDDDGSSRSEADFGALQYWR